MASEFLAAFGSARGLCTSRSRSHTPASRSFLPRAGLEGEAIADTNLMSGFAPNNLATSLPILPVAPTSVTRTVPESVIGKPFQVFGIGESFIDGNPE